MAGSTHRMERSWNQIEGIITTIDTFTECLVPFIHYENEKQCGIEDGNIIYYHRDKKDKYGGNSYTQESKTIATLHTKQHSTEMISCFHFRHMNIA